MEKHCLDSRGYQLTRNLKQFKSMLNAGKQCDERNSEGHSPSKEALIKLCLPKGALALNYNMGHIHQLDVS